MDGAAPCRRPRARAQVHRRGGQGATGLRLRPRSSRNLGPATAATLDSEELWMLCLDGRHGLRAAHMVAKGEMQGLRVNPADVLRQAISEGVSAFVLVHNHPSGDPTPSDEDLEFTRRVALGCAAVGLTQLDHVIVARERSSMLERGILPIRERR